MFPLHVDIWAPEQGQVLLLMSLACVSIVKIGGCWPYVLLQLQLAINRVPWHLWGSGKRIGALVSQL